MLNIDYRKTIDAFRALGVRHFDRLFTQAGQLELFDRFDRGELSPGVFCAELRRLTECPLTDREIVRAWNAMLLDMPAGRIGLLERVRRNYRLFLLSNTNAIHYPAYRQLMQKEHGIDDLSALFEKHYLSHMIGMRKPDMEVYELIMQENGLEPFATLFLDDTPGHVAGARRAGMHAIWLDVPRVGVEGLFTEAGRLKGVAGKMARAPLPC